MTRKRKFPTRKKTNWRKHVRSWKKPDNSSKTKKKRNKSKILQKEEEFPNIKWKDLTDQNVQFATLIYNDRINTWRDMKALDEEIDHSPNEQKVKKLAELRIRNLLCFSELESFNNTGKWKYEHPIIAYRSERNQLAALKKNNPAAFLKKHASCLRNIGKYRTFLKKEERAALHESDKENLKKYLDRKTIFEDLLKEDAQS